MKHIVIFNSGYVPAKTYGGPVVSVSNLVKLLKGKYIFTIITNAYEIDQKTLIPGVKKNILNKSSENEYILYLDEKHNNNNYIYKQLADLPSVDLVYVNSLFSANQLQKAYKMSKVYNINILVAPRGELEKNALKIKKYKKNVFLKLFKNWLKFTKNIYFQATSSEEILSIKDTLNLNEKRIILLENIPTINNSTDPQKKHLSKKKNNLNLIFVSRIQSKKNLLFALKTLSKVNKNILVTYDIYGPIENEKYWQECQNMISNLPENVIVNYKGTLKHERIFNTFYNYDLFYLPTLSENFGHVIYESLASYCPVLISDQTPWNDINETMAGKAIALDKEEEFIDYLNYIGNLNSDDYRLNVMGTKKYLGEKINVNNIVKQYYCSFDFLMVN